MFSTDGFSMKKVCHGSQTCGSFVKGVPLAQVLVLRLPTALIFVLLKVHILLSWVCESFPNKKVVTGTEVCEVLVQMQFNPIPMAVGQLDMSMT